jgi:hypothetical protein
MSRIRIFAIYTVINLLIVCGALWCAVQRWPVRNYLIPAAVLFVVNGVWLIVMTVRNTPPTAGLGN